MQSYSSNPVTRTAVFMDISGSTGGDREYWEYAERIVKNHGSDAVYYLWDDKCRERTDYASVLMQIASRRGHGGQISR